MGREFFGMMEPFIYRRSLDFEAIEKIKSMKNRINKSMKGKFLHQENIKLGFGGIREIEFIIQAINSYLAAEVGWYGIVPPLLKLLLNL